MKKIAKKIVSFVVVLTLVISTLAQVTYAAPISGTIRLSGSTSVYPLVQALRESFKAKYPAVNISLVNITGSGAGIADAINGSKVHYGMSSRGLTDAEKVNLNQDIIALDGVAIVVNKNNPLANITNAQLFDIFTGKINNWNQITPGSTLGEIATVNREAGSGTRSCFEDVFKNDYKTALTSGYDRHDKSTSIQNTTGAVKNTVSSTAGAIGYMALGDVDSSVKVITFNGVAATKANISNRTYEFNRPFVFVSNKKSYPSEAAKAFLAYILSDEGQKIVDKEGFVKLPKTIINVTSVKLNATKLTIKVGKTATLKTTVAPTNATITAVNYTSSNPKIATVNPATGVVKAIKKGTCKITVKSENSGKTAVCTVTVN